MAESTKASFQSPPVLDIIPNPSPHHVNLVAYITRTYPHSPHGSLFLYDISTQKSEQLDSETKYTCLTLSTDGDILMACTRYGEVLYYNLIEREKAPIRRPSPIDLPQPDGDTWWSILHFLYTLISSHTRSLLDRYMESTRYLQSSYASF